MSNPKRDFLKLNVGHLFKNPNHSYEKFFIRPTGDVVMIFFNHIINEVLQQHEEPPTRSPIEVLCIINSFLKRISNIKLFYAELLFPNRTTLMSMEVILLHVSKLKGERGNIQPMAEQVKLNCQQLDSKKSELEQLKKEINEYSIEYQQVKDKTEKNEERLLAKRRDAGRLDEATQKALARQAKLVADNENCIRQIADVGLKLEETNQAVQEEAKLEQVFSSFDDKQKELSSLNSAIKELEKLDVFQDTNVDPSVLSKLQELEEVVDKLFEISKQLSSDQKCHENFKEQIATITSTVAEIKRSMNQKKAEVCNQLIHVKNLSEENNILEHNLEVVHTNIQNYTKAIWEISESLKDIYSKCETTSTMAHELFESYVADIETQSLHALELTDKFF